MHLYCMDLIDQKCGLYPLYRHTCNAGIRTCPRTHALPRQALTTPGIEASGAGAATLALTPPAARHTCIKFIRATSRHIVVVRGLDSCVNSWSDSGPDGGESCVKSWSDSGPDGGESCVNSWSDSGPDGGESCVKCMVTCTVMDPEPAPVTGPAFSALGCSTA